MKAKAKPGQMTDQRRVAALRSAIAKMIRALDGYNITGAIRIGDEALKLTQAVDSAR